MPPMCPATGPIPSFGRKALPQGSKVCLQKLLVIWALVLLPGKTRNRSEVSRVTSPANGKYAEKSQRFGKRGKVTCFQKLKKRRWENTVHLGLAPRNIVLCVLKLRMYQPCQLCKPCPGNLGQHPHKSDPSSPTNLSHCLEC